MQGTQTASLDTSKSLVYVGLIVVLAAIPFDNFTGMPNKEPREVTFASICAFGVSFTFFSVRRESFGLLNDC